MRGTDAHDIKVEPELIEKIRITNRLRTATYGPVERLPIPVSVKTRLGYDRIVVEDWVSTLLEENPAAISLHGRTLQQG